VFAQADTEGAVRTLFIAPTKKKLKSIDELQVYPT
jgi:hypothetical protein